MGRPAVGFYWTRISPCPVLISFYPPPSHPHPHPSSISLFVRLTEQETPVRVKMKELQGRWMCAERVCEMNECPSCPLSPSEMPCLDTKAKKVTTTWQQVRTEVTLLCDCKACSLVHIFIAAPHLAPVIRKILGSNQQRSARTHQHDYHPLPISPFSVHSHPSEMHPEER